MKTLVVIQVKETVDRIYVLGIHLFPISVALRMARSAFIFDGLANRTMGMREIYAASKLLPSFAERFSIFYQQQLQRQAEHQQSTGAKHCTCFLTFNTIFIPRFDPQHMLADNDTTFPENERYKKGYRYDTQIVFIVCSTCIKLCRPCIQKDMCYG